MSTSSNCFTDKKLKPSLIFESEVRHKTLEVDLFSEVHQRLVLIEKEKISRMTDLRDAQENLNKCENKLQTFMAKMTLLAEHVDELNKEDNEAKVATSKNDAKEKIADLHEQIKNLKSLLSTKTNQIAMLRVATVDLNSKYKNEKQINSELRDELKILKKELIGLIEKEKL